MKHREFNFNPAIRKQIAANMLAAWKAANPKPEWQGMPTGEQMRQRQAWTEERDSFATTVGMVLSTIKGSAHLREDWPEAAEFLPLALTDPSKGVSLPAASKADKAGPFAAKERA